jgi:hypothetical protein
VQSDGKFTVTLRCMPNSYYKILGTIKVPPSVTVVYRSAGRVAEEVLPIHVDGKGAAGAGGGEEAGACFRTLTWPALRTGGSCRFYDTPRMPARSQPAILYASRYPGRAGHEPADFWGGCPPH